MEDCDLCHRELTMSVMMSVTKKNQWDTRTLRNSGTEGALNEMWRVLESIKNSADKMEERIS